jgi:hypothetical protein
MVDFAQYTDRVEGIHLRGFVGLLVALFVGNWLIKYMNVRRVSRPRLYC